MTNHGFGKCPTFKTWNQQKRYNHITSVNACMNCLHPGSTVGTAKANISVEIVVLITTLFYIGKKKTILMKIVHQPLLETTLLIPVQLLLPEFKTLNESTILSTALVNVSSERYMKPTRLLMDSGASISLITSSLAQELQAKLSPCEISISGVGGETVSKLVTNVTLSSAFHDDGDSITVQYHVVEKLVETLPCCNIDELVSIHQLPCLEGKQLADPPGFGKTSKIEILLGVGDCLSPEFIQPENTAILITKTLFGWTISGQTSSVKSSGIVLSVSQSKTEATDQLLQKLWEREETPECSAVTQYLDEYVRLPSGRYQVSLPWKRPGKHELGELRNQALKRFVQNKRNLLKKEKLDDFNKVLAEYESLGHAEKVPQEDLSKPVEKTYYLLMHGVFKASSSTTKLRIVFNASAKTSNGLSLNDLILPGPSLYPMITSLIIKFRTHKIAISSDISKMFREIVLNPEHRDFH